MPPDPHNTGETITFKCTEDPIRLTVSLLLVVMNPDFVLDPPKLFRAQFPYRCSYNNIPLFKF
jgi:hypothetical protein